MHVDDVGHNVKDAVPKMDMALTPSPKRPPVFSASDDGARGWGWTAGVAYMNEPG